MLGKLGWPILSKGAGTPDQGWPVAFTGGICHQYLPVWTILPKVAFTGIYKFFIDFSSNYIVDSPSYLLYCTWTP